MMFEIQDFKVGDRVVCDMKVKVNGIKNASWVRFSENSGMYRYGNAYIHDIPEFEYGEEKNFPEVFDMSIREKRDKKVIHLNPSTAKDYDGVVYFVGFSGKSCTRNGYAIVLGGKHIHKTRHSSSTGAHWSSEFVIVLPDKETIAKIGYWRKDGTGTDYDEVAVFEFSGRKDIPAELDE